MITVFGLLLPWFKLESGGNLLQKLFFTENIISKEVIFCHWQKLHKRKSYRIVNSRLKTKKKQKKKNENAAKWIAQNTKQAEKLFFTVVTN